MCECYYFFFIASLSIQSNCTLTRPCICCGALEQTQECIGEPCSLKWRAPSDGGRGRVWNRAAPLLPQTALSPWITSYHFSVIFQSLIFSSCEPIGWLTPLSCFLQRYLGIRYLRSHFTRVWMCVHPENKVPLVLVVWCQAQFLIPFYKALLLLMQQLVDY